jgi:hypothetical protein
MRGLVFAAVCAFFVGLAGAAFAGNPAINPGSANLQVTNAGTLVFEVDSNNNVVLAGTGSALATTATSGFSYLPSCAGVPTGTPGLSLTGAVPMVVNSTGTALYAYIAGAWSNLSGGTSSLQGAYNGGSSITVASGTTPLIEHASNDNTDALAVTQSPTSTGENANGITITMGSHGNGNGVSIADSAGAGSANGILSNMSATASPGYAAKFTSAKNTAQTTPDASTLLVTGVNVTGGTFAAAQFEGGTNQNVLVGLNIDGSDNTGGTIMATNVSATAVSYWGCSVTNGGVNDSVLYSLGSSNGIRIVTAGGPIGFSVATSTAVTAFASSRPTTVMTLGSTGVTSYAGVATAGIGIVPIYATAEITGQTTNATILTYITPAGSADADFEVSATMNVSAATAISTQIRLSYADTNNTPQSIVFPIPTSATGAFLTGGTIAGPAPADYATVTLRIRCHENTTIQVVTLAGTFTGVTYSASASVLQVR